MPLLEKVRELSLAEAFGEAARAHAGRAAVESDGRRLTYRELDAWSGRVAEGLPPELGPGSFVGLSFGRTEALVAAMLAVLKRGCAFVPLDPCFPPERLRYFCRDCGLRLVLADRASRAALGRAGLEGLRFIEPGPRPGPGPAPSKAGSWTAPADGLAYVIYTSGSTGEPKGVMVENRSVVRMIRACAAGLGFKPGGSVSLTASISADASVQMIFLPLLTGGRLHIASEGSLRDPALLHESFRAAGLSHVILPAALLCRFPRRAWPGLEAVAFGGDTVDEASARWWSARTDLFTLYGPTETTVMASMGRIAPGAPHRTIGRPLPGYRLYLLDPGRRPVPAGAAGEICIGGDGLARGYLGRGALTAQRFVPDPFRASPGARMYLSGDLGRSLEDGSIEFVGRADSQVKLRGHRIELGEIESRLAGFPGVEQAVCAVKGQGEERRLTAYYLARTVLSEKALRAHLAAFLPEHMVPAFFVRLRAWPLSPGGKIDREALPAVSSRTCERPPRAGLERELADAWEEVLGLKGVGRDESFFDLGGDSLSVAHLQAVLRERLGLELSIARFYGAPTIEALAGGGGADHIERAVSDARTALEVRGPGPRAALRPRPGRFLLTGARGFLGIHLLAELCRRAESVRCLVRCPSERSGREALLERAREAGLELDLGKVRVLPGDLSAPGLGLPEDAREELAAELDAVLHCGACVHHLRAYPAMRAANVGGTRALLELAATARLKSFCFVSTLTAGALAEGAAAVREEVLPERPAADNGYLLTKWAAEQLCAQASARFGLPVLIARPGNITGASTTGYSNFSENRFWLFHKGCLQLGAYPAGLEPVEMTPVDVLARQVAGLALSPRPGVSVANLDNPRSLSRDEFFARLAACGCKARALPSADWRRLLAGIGEDNALWTIRELHASGLPAGAPPVERARTRAMLEAAGLRPEADYDRWIPLYVENLREAGFL